MNKPPIPIHDLHDKLGEAIPFDFISMEEKQHHVPGEPHRHNYYEIFFFLKGGGTHEIDFMGMPIESNVLHFISPGQVHVINRALKSNGYIILFSKEFFHLGLQNKDILPEMPLFNNNDGKPAILVPDSELSLFKDLFDKIKTEFLGQNPDHLEMIRSYLNALLLYCNRLFVSETKSGHQIKGAGTELVNKFRTLIEKKFMHEHSVSEYAKLLLVTASHLNESTQKQLGKSAGELIHERLILEAKRLLYHSEQSINEIAYDLNFEDPSYFTKFFKKHTGTTPGAYRTEIREKYQN